MNNIDKQYDKIFDTILDTTAELCESPSGLSYYFKCPFCKRFISELDSTLIPMNDIKHEKNCIYLLTILLKRPEELL